MKPDVFKHVSVWYDSTTWDDTVELEQSCYYTDADSMTHREVKDLFTNMRSLGFCMDEDYAMLQLLALAQHVGHMPDWGCNVLQDTTKDIAARVQPTFIDLEV